jgi:hypothetical protein
VLVNFEEVIINPIEYINNDKNNKSNFLVLLENLFHVKDLLKSE